MVKAGGSLLGQGKLAKLGSKIRQRNLIWKNLDWFSVKFYDTAASCMLSMELIWEWLVSPRRGMIHWNTRSRVNCNCKAYLMRWKKNYRRGHVNTTLTLSIELAVQLMHFEHDCYHSCNCSKTMTKILSFICSDKIQMSIIAVKY